MLTGLAWAWRETQGPAAMPAAPPASFRKARRVVFDRAGCAIYPPVCDVDRPWENRRRPAPEPKPTGLVPAPAAMILLPAQGHRQEPPPLKKSLDVLTV